MQDGLTSELRKYRDDDDTLTARELQEVLYKISVVNQRAPTPGPRNYKIYTGGDATRFLGMWLVDSSMEALMRA